MTGAMTPFTGRTGANPTGFDTGWTTWTTGVGAGWSVRLRIIDATVWVNVDSGSQTVGSGQTVVATGLPGSTPAGWQIAYVGGSPGLAAVSAGGNLAIRNPSSTPAVAMALISYPLE